MPDPTKKQFVPPGWALTHRLAWIILPLLVVGCSGGGSDAPQSITAPPGPPPPPPPPATAGLIYSTRRVEDNPDGTPGALIRSQTDGTGQVTLADGPGLVTVLWRVFISGSTMVYQIFNPPDDFGPQDIWQVQIDGTGNRFVVGAGGTLDVIGPWVVYDVNGTTRAVRLDGTGQHVITNDPAGYQLHVGERLVFVRSTDRTLFSVLLDGTDLRVLTTLPPDSSVPGALGSQVVFSVYNGTSGTQQIFAVPITGGPVTTLVAGSDYASVAALVGARLVYQRCPLIGTTTVAGPCDVYSVNSDGSGTVALGTQPTYEAFQGVSGSQVVIRRVGGATDSLYSIPIMGGPETHIRTLDAQFEFVVLFVEDRIILLRAVDPFSGLVELWSVRNDGRDMVQLTDDAYRLTLVRSTGSFACFSRGPRDLWCVPADGSGPATLVTPDGEFVVGL